MAARLLPTSTSQPNTAAQAASPAAIFTPNGSVSGDQKASTNAAAVNIAAAPYIIMTAGFVASTSARLRVIWPGDMTARPNRIPAAPESTIAVSSSAEWPAMNDQNCWP